MRGPIAKLNRCNFPKLGVLLRFKLSALEISAGTAFDPLRDTSGKDTSVSEVLPRAWSATSFNNRDARDLVADLVVSRLLDPVDVDNCGISYIGILDVQFVGV